jgi:GNAT superfamily N-acetyltransferase
MGSFNPVRTATGTATAPAIDIVEARTPDQFAAAAALVRAFIAWARVRHDKDAWAVDMYFGTEIEDELATLAQRFAPPHRAVLLALADGEPAASVILDRFDDRTCRMRRLFVREAAQGRGIGRMLTASLIALARERGYGVMRLETSIYLKEAQALYRSFGFREVPCYLDMPKSLLPLSVFMELEL